MEPEPPQDMDYDDVEMDEDAELQQALMLSMLEVSNSRRARSCLPAASRSRGGHRNQQIRQIMHDYGAAVAPAGVCAARRVDPTA